MGTLTIRNLPDDLVDRIKEAAAGQGHSMEQEVRDLLQRRYATRAEVLARLQERWRQYPTASAQEIAAWIAEGRE